MLKNNAPNILIADDEVHVLETLEKTLHSDAARLQIGPINIHRALDPGEVLDIARTNRIDVAVLDLKYGVDGVGTTREIGLQLISKLGAISDCGILILSSEKNTDALAESFSRGADQYLEKRTGEVVDAAVLIALIVALLQNLKKFRNDADYFQPDGIRYEIGDTEFELGKRQLKVESTQLDLTQLEYALLRVLLSSDEYRMSRTGLAYALYGEDDDATIRKLANVISRFRKKIRGAFSIRLSTGSDEETYAIDSPVSKTIAS